jgi:hypothetical protein
MIETAITYTIIKRLFMFDRIIYPKWFIAKDIPFRIAARRLLELVGFAEVLIRQWHLYY